jgi:Coenzyme PQQ synthesis protein D (PqqD)
MPLQISDSVIWQETGGSISLYHTESGDFRTLNETGAKIWVLVASDGERETVISKLALLFAGRNPALGARIRAEADEFISSMVEEGLLSESLPR